jgi:hypothetical protein
MITAPPMIRTKGLDKTVEPMSPAAAPSETKINDNPALNASELTKTELRVEKFESACFIWSMLMPDINEM